MIPLEIALIMNNVIKTNFALFQKIVFIIAKKKNKVSSLCFNELLKAFILMKKLKNAILVVLAVLFAWALLKMIA